MSEINQASPESQGSFILKTWVFSCLCLLMLVGIWVSDQLVLEHISLKLGDKADSGICGASTMFSCKAAAKSAYGSLFGLPIAAIGEAFYLTGFLALITIKISDLRGQMSAESSWGAMLLTTLAGAVSLSVLYSIFLGAVSVLSLGLICPLCVSLYVLNISIGALLWSCYQPRSISRLKGWQRQWVMVWKTAAPWLLTLLMGASLTLAQGAYANRWREGLRALKAERLQNPTQVTVSTEGPTRGESSAAAVVEFSDFQCPFCRRFALQLKKASAELNQTPEHRFQYTFKHYPLSNACNPHVKRDMHPRACHAAAASICAEEQGKFWEMHDLLFENQQALEDEDLGKYARTLELDMDAFVECLPSERVKKRIRSDIRQGRKAKLKGTPAFYINGWRFAGAVGAEKIVELIKRYAYGIIEEEAQ